MPWPKSWLWSAGLPETASAHSATSAATRLTIDSSASERKPTEPVIQAAEALMATVSTAVTTDSITNFIRNFVDTVSSGVDTLLCMGDSSFLAAGPLGAEPRKG